LLAMHSHQLLIYKKTTIVELNPFRAAQHEATQDEEPTRSEPSLLLKILESFETHWLYATAAQLYRVWRGLLASQMTCAGFWRCTKEVYPSGHFHGGVPICFTTYTLYIGYRLKNRLHKAVGWTGVNLPQQSCNVTSSQLSRLRCRQNIDLHAYLFRV
jgi:hypothetical protein